MLLTILIGLGGLAPGDVGRREDDREVEKNSGPFRIIDHEEAQEVEEDQRALAVLLRKERDRDILKLPARSCH